MPLSFLLTIALILQIYFKNIYADIKTSSLAAGETQSLFKVKPDIPKKLVCEYLYSQGYFNTLAEVDDDFKTSYPIRSTVLNKEL